MRRFTLLFFTLLVFMCVTTDSLAGKEKSEYEQWLDKGRQAIAAASVCKQVPKSDGERFALTMREYWQREIQSLWQQDARLNQYYLGAQGRIDVTDKDCGLIRDGAGNPQRIGRDTCYPWKLEEYNTLDKLTERLKLVPEFGATRGFAQPTSHEGGWIYDEIVRGLLGGEVNHPETEALYLPEHAGGKTGFAVLHKRGNAVRWYGPDCCRLVSIAEGEEQWRDLRKDDAKQAVQISLVGTISLPPGIAKEDLRYLRVSYRDVDFNLTSGQGGVNALGKGEIDDFNLYVFKYFLVSPCGVIICLEDNMGPSCK